ncbi:hypothetical protein CMZ84_04170 [Lysobacteraceae bacterium NML93-0399]|nr:hypothetical protein CMZ84_04170 [Xanthomonadaceae bacterium NML93-0399]
MKQVFPRPVFDASGRYTVSEAAAFVISNPACSRYAAIVYARRDLQHALELMEACCSDEVDEAHPLLEQAAWTAAIVNYSKPFKCSNARSPKKLDELTGLITGHSLEVHKEALTLRDKMFAHDDGLGESKLVSLFLPARPPRSRHEFGIGVGTWRVTGLGQDRAKHFVPHFAHVLNLCTGLEEQAHIEAQASLMTSGFSDIVLLGIAQEDKPHADVNTDGSATR